MAKTSQALREGAPQIRAAHKDELEENRIKATARRTREKTEALTPPPLVAAPLPSVPLNPGIYAQNVVEELRANVEAAKRKKEEEEKREEPSSKRIRMEHKGNEVLPDDETPPLTPTTSPANLEFGAPLLPPPMIRNGGNGFNRVNSLALSDFSLGEWANEEFVNPFEDENEREIVSQRMPRPGVSAFNRETSNSSDMAGIGALFQSMDSGRSVSSGSSGHGVTHVRPFGFTRLPWNPA
jgi:hypothetical protein